jgi:cysteine desulfurase/selenocysteine lyase
MINWSSLREEHLGKTEVLYLNSPANGLISSQNIANEYAETEKYLAHPGKYRLDFMLETIPAIKHQLADIIDATPTEIALVQNFSIGINFFVSALPKGTKVLLIEDDYPSLILPFQLNGLEICWLKFEENKTLDLEKLESVIKTEKPDIVAISHCQWLTGYVADLRSIGAICKEHNSLFFVDATQSFGATDIDVKKCNISILGASCYKWALAGFGNGFMYINQHVLQKYTPTTGGFGSYSWENGEPKYFPSIKSYEPGHHDHAAFHRLHFALNRISEIGLDSLQAKIEELMDYLIEELEEKKISIIGNFLDENRLGIISIASRPNLFKHLINCNIEVSERGGNIRLGVHYYNNENDINHFITALSKLQL